MPAAVVMRHALADLLRNLRAGLRLACFRPVDRLAFRLDLPQLLLLFLMSALIDVVGGWDTVATLLQALGAGLQHLARS